MTSQRSTLGLLLGFLAFFSWCPSLSWAITEDIEVTPTNTNGIELGDLTMTQFVFFMVVFLKLVTLYAMGVIPIEFDLSNAFSKDSDYYYYDDDSFGGGEFLQYGNMVDDGMQFLQVPGQRARHGQRFERNVEMSTFLLDCPLQFVCEVDAWAHRDHEDLVSNLIASWFRHPNKTWHHENARIYGGASTCRQMYPCPFPVQDVMGIHIPGSPESNHLQEDEGDEDILPLGLF
ncbi:uncharacterized protein LOC143023391 [Oratosquilla oratoria]|uniref:uncharacterized protein LOC143023391 n=1 Tax=Oratosquilla oratoria TaxID=337810 RepID=UPI003F75966B